MENQNSRGSQEEKIFTQKQEWFRKQPPEIQWRIIKPFLDLYISAISTKMAVLPSLSAISATLLIVATLNRELIPIGINGAKIILSILLFLIPSSLFVHILEQEGAAKKALQNWGEYQKEIENFYKRKKTWWDNLKEKITNSRFWSGFASEFPICVALIYLIIIIYLLYMMWR